MIELLKKDWRNNRAAVIGGLVLLAMPYLTALISLLARQVPMGPRERIGAIGGAAIIDLGLAVILSGVFGGIAFALERRDCSMDFLVMMPVRRGRIVLSKFIVIAACLATVWLINVAVIGVCNQYELALPGDVILSDLTISIMAFGMAWFCSSFLESPAISASIGVGAAIALYVGIMSVSSNLGWSDAVCYHILWVWTTVVGFVAFIAGTIYWMRRVKP